MKRSVLNLSTIALILLTNQLNANLYQAGKLLKHKEWTSGTIDLDTSFSISNSKSHIYSKKQTTDEELETILIMPQILSVSTNYDKPDLIRTVVKTRFQVQIMGYYPYVDTQYFTIGRNICIYPMEGTPIDGYTCSYSEDFISITSDTLNIVDVKLSAHNLPRGDYYADADMFVVEGRTMTPAIQYKALSGEHPFSVGKGLVVN